MTGENIRKLRRELNLTQAEFAKGIGSTQNTVTGYESGRRNPSSSVINNICKTFNVNEDWLRYGESPMFVEMNDEEKLIELFKRCISGKSEEELQTIKDFLTLILKK